MNEKKPFRLLAISSLMALIVSACSASGDSEATTTSGEGTDTTVATGGNTEPIVFWTAEDNAERVAAMEQIAARFTASSGIEVEVVAIAEDQLAAQTTAAAAADDLPDLFGAISLGFAHSLAADGLSDGQAAAEVVDSLGRDTFSTEALNLMSVGGQLIAVPSDGWMQLLLYRTDLFEAAGLDVPDTYDAIMTGATTLNEGSMAGIVAATGPADSFTQQTFEYFALGNNCQVVDDAGDVTIDSPECVETFQFYTDLIQQGSVAGIQDADTTRAAYFAGEAAMMVWSSFILDELAGLRNDALPTCPECVDDPSFLVDNTGFVTAVSGPSGEPSLFGEMVAFSIVEGGNEDAAKQFVEFMMSDGYVDWLALAPEGKFPTRLGTASNPTEYADAWQNLTTGVDTKAQLSELFDGEVLEALTAGVLSMDRWGFPQGQGRIVGPLLVELPIPNALGLALDGTLDPAGSVAEAEALIEEIVKSLE
jgi:multiple sugar transport system substrate-binding protein